MSTPRKSKSKQQGMSRAKCRRIMTHLRFSEPIVQITSAKLAGILSPDDCLLSTLCQNIGNHAPADVGEAEIATAVLVGQPSVVDTE